MTVSALHKAFKLLLDKSALGIDYGGCPAFVSEEVDQFLNLAYLAVITNKFTGNNTLQQPFESSIKRLSDLLKLVVTDGDIPATLEYANVIKLDNFTDGYEGDRLFCVNVVLHFSDDDQQYCQMVSHETANKFLKTYNNDPWIDTPVATLEDDTLRIYVDSRRMIGPYTVDITYVKMPTIINYKEPGNDITEVPDTVLYEVIDRAVLIALDNIESQRTQTKAQLNTTQE